MQLKKKEKKQYVDGISKKKKRFFLNKCDFILLSKWKIDDLRKYFWSRDNQGWRIIPGENEPGCRRTISFQHTHECKKNVYRRFG